MAGMRLSRSFALSTPSPAGKSTRLDGGRRHAKLRTCLGNGQPGSLHPINPLTPHLPSASFFLRNLWNSTSAGDAAQRKWCSLSFSRQILLSPLFQSCICPSESSFFAGPKGVLSRAVKSLGRALTLLRGVLRQSWQQNITATAAPVESPNSQIATLPPE